MAVRYNKLWKLLVDRKMSKADLRRAADISSNTLTKLSKDECVALPILDRICEKLKVDYGDIIVHIFDREDRLFYNLERIWRDGEAIDPAALSEGD